MVIAPQETLPPKEVAVPQPTSRSRKQTSPLISLRISLRTRSLRTRSLPSNSRANSNSSSPTTDESHTGRAATPGLWSFQLPSQALLGAVSPRSSAPSAYQFAASGRTLVPRARATLFHRTAVRHEQRLPSTLDLRPTLAIDLGFAAKPPHRVPSLLNDIRSHTVLSSRLQLFTDRVMPSTSNLRVILR